MSVSVTLTDFFIKDDQLVDADSVRFMHSIRTLVIACTKMDLEALDVLVGFPLETLALFFEHELPESFEHLLRILESTDPAARFDRLQHLELRNRRKQTRGLSVEDQRWKGLGLAKP